MHKKIYFIKRPKSSESHGPSSFYYADLVLKKRFLLMVKIIHAKQLLLLSISMESVLFQKIIKLFQKLE